MTVTLDIINFEIDSDDMESIFSCLMHVHENTLLNFGDSWDCFTAGGT
jgi:hypothetical protein